jgi:NADP-dependent 3-hydroxy acid dehydrogenase YdfG
VTEIPYRIALIVGAGSGISASFARGLAAVGLRVGLAARNAEKLAPLAAEIGAETFAVDASDPAAVARLFAEADAALAQGIEIKIMRARIGVDTRDVKEGDYDGEAGSFGTRGLQLSRGASSRAAHYAVLR